MSESPKEHQVSEPDISGTYTARDYLQWKMEELAELIRGKLVKMSPSPSSNHQRISLELILQLGAYFKDKDCQLFEAPYDVYLTKDATDYKSTKNIVQPDLCVICDAGKIKPFGCVGAPDLVVEILSPSTAHKDQKDKLELYQEYGVKEYWMISPESKSVLRLNLTNGSYQTAGPFTTGHAPSSHLFPDLMLDLEELFKNVEEPKPE